MAKLMIANWKENPTTERSAMDLFMETARAKRGRSVQVVICPPFVYLEPIGKKLKSLRSKKNFALGAQDVFWEEHGPYTGGEGPRMLRALGVGYAIVGHSERRKFFRETDLMVNQKVRAALMGGLAVVLCVGEPMRIRKKGIAAARRFVRNQLEKDLKNLDFKSSVRGSRLIIAYEPIWAIGTGKNDSPSDAAAMAAFIRKTTSAIARPPSYVLYGGSVNGANVLDYVSCKGIDGALVGGASLNPIEFKQMIERIAKHKS